MLSTLLDLVILSCYWFYCVVTPISSHICCGCGVCRRFSMPHGAHVAACGIILATWLRLSFLSKFFLLMRLWHNFLNIFQGGKICSNTIKRLGVYSCDVLIHKPSLFFQVYGELVEAVGSFGSFGGLGQRHLALPAMARPRRPA